MKWIHSFDKKKKRISIIIIIGISVLFFSCTKLHLSASECQGDGGTEECESADETIKVVKKPADIVIILDSASRHMQDIYSQVSANLSQFLQCVDVIDWRIGIISSLGGSNNQHSLGKLLNLEIDGQLSAKTFINSHVDNYKQVFSDTVSLDSGCDYPPYCKKGPNKPLSALKSFMEKEVSQNTSDTFLRQYVPLAAVIISVSDEENGMFSGPGVSAQGALSSIYAHYSTDQFIGLTVTDSRKKDDCVATGNFISTGAEILSTAGQFYGAITMDPAVILGSGLLSRFSADTPEKFHSSEIVQFAKQAEGHIFDICSPLFGKALAYSILQKIGAADQFPEKCKQFEQQHLEQVDSI